MPKQPVEIVPPPPPIDREPIESSLIKSAGFHRDMQIMEIEFRPNGSGDGPVYRYFEVRQKDYDDFLAADSRGSFFLKKIKGKFAFAKVEAKKQ